MGFQKWPKSKAVVVMPPAKVVTPPPCTPMLPVMAWRVSKPCMCRSPWYQCERPKPTRTASGLPVPQIWAREMICAAGRSVSWAVYSGVKRGHGVGQGLQGRAGLQGAGGMGARAGRATLPTGRWPL